MSSYLPGDLNTFVMQDTTCYQHRHPCTLLLGLEAVSSSSTLSFLAMPLLAYRALQRPRLTSLISRRLQYQASLLHVNMVPTVLYGIRIDGSMALLLV